MIRGIGFLWVRRKRYRAIEAEQLEY